MMQLYSASPDEMCEWMTAIDAAIQGVPGKAEHRMRSASVSYRMKVNHWVYKCGSVIVHVLMYPKAISLP